MTPAPSVRLIADDRADDLERWIQSVLDPAGIGAVDWRISDDPRHGRRADRSGGMDHVRETLTPACRKRLAASRWGHLSSTLKACTVEDLSEACDTFGTDLPTIIDAMLEVQSLRARGGWTPALEQIADDLEREAAYWDELERLEQDDSYSPEHVPTSAYAAELDAWVTGAPTWAPVPTSAPEVPEVPEVPTMVGAWAHDQYGWHVLPTAGAELVTGRNYVARARKGPHYVHLIQTAGGRWIRS